MRHRPFDTQFPMIAPVFMESVLKECSLVARRGALGEEVGGAASD